jgi:hypothetical protein
LLQHRTDGTWGLPGGGLHPGEDPWEGALRESTEELGELPAGLKPRLTLARETGKEHNPDVIKVGPEGYIHGYICVRPPCGDKKPASLDKETGKLTHPDGSHLGTISKNPDGSYSAQHSDGTKLAGRYVSQDDAAKVLSIHHNLGLLRDNLEDSKPGGKNRGIYNSLDQAAWNLQSDGGPSDMMNYSLKSAKENAVQNGNTVLADHIDDAQQALGDVKTAPKVKPVKPPRKLLPSPKPGKAKPLAKLEPPPQFATDSLAGITRLKTQKEAISRLNSGTKGFPSTRIDKIPWAYEPLNVVTGEGDDSGDFNEGPTVAVMSYMDVGTHDELANQLRSGGDLGDFGNTVKQLDDLINSNSLTADSTLYRGMSVNPDMLSQLKIGTTFSDKSYVSTASKPSSAKYYSTLRSYTKGYKTGEIPVIMKITAPAGTHVAMGDPTVNEVILPRNTTFHVDSIDSRGVINVSVVPA